MGNQPASDVDGPDMDESDLPKDSEWKQWAVREMEGATEGETERKERVEEGRNQDGRTRRDESADGQGPDWKLGKVTERWRTGLPPSGANDGGRNTSKVADAFVHCQQLGYLIGTGSTHRDSSMVHYEDLTESENKCQFAADGALADTVQKSTVHGFSDRADGQETAHEDNPESLYG
ncbi:hypothetical protein VTN49DRAFT_1400 [Thermomyces lanuginosus]|uniref:uncharacterized protein n=1 Tax=Thermomyces lanuginosus TaxID=5541 RepID=UPI003742E6A7